MDRTWGRRLVVLVLCGSLIAGAGVVPAAATPATGTNDAAGGALADGVNATAAWERGYTGENVTVAVVDGDFDADHPAIAAQVVRTEAVGGPGQFDVPDAHGTELAGLVLRGAPDARLALYDTAGGGETQAAAIRQASRHADVIVMAHGAPFNGPADGTGVVAGAIDDAEANGTTVVVAAGNRGYEQTYHGNWTDADDDGRHEFDGTDETLHTSFTNTVWLKWTDWDGVDSNYDVHVYGPNGTEIASVTYDQRESNWPVTTVEVPTLEGVEIVVTGDSPDPNDQLTMYFEPAVGDPEYATGAYSLSPYTTAEGAISAGAYDVSAGELAPYSSRGPTVDGRTKPEVVGPANVSAVTGDGRFTGTSASAPAVASVAALVIDADESASPDRVESILTETATPVRDPVPNNRTGHGLVNASAAVAMAADEDPSPPSVTGDAPPRDPDDDGAYEDVDGSGAVDFNDLVAYYQHKDDPVMTDQVAAYDYTGDDELDFNDLVALYQNHVR